MEVALSLTTGGTIWSRHVVLGTRLADAPVAHPLLTVFGVTWFTAAHRSLLATCATHILATFGTCAGVTHQRSPRAPASHPLLV